MLEQWSVMQCSYLVELWKITLDQGRCTGNDSPPCIDRVNKKNLHEYKIKMGLEMIDIFLGSSSQLTLDAL